MFTETSFGENDGEIKEESSVIDLDFGIQNLSVSPVPYDSSGPRGDESSATMATSDVSASDVLLSAFDSISLAECPNQRPDLAKNIIRTDAVGTDCQVGLPGQGTDEGNNTGKFDSSDFDQAIEPSTHGEAEVVGEMDKTQKPNHPLLVYTSSRRKSSRSTNTKLSQNNESRKPSRNCRRIPQKKSVVDLDCMKISRRRRSLFPQRARSSGWGLLGNIVPAFEECSELDSNLDNEKKASRVTGGQGKRNAIRIRHHTGQTPVRKSSTPTGHISLKIKIGNLSCGMVNVKENFNASGKIIPGLPEKGGIKFGEELPGDMVLPHDSNLEKVMSSDASIFGTHLDVKGSVENTSFSTSSDLHQSIGREEGDHTRASSEIMCSDPGTSPDSEVINSVPDTPLIEKGLPNMQGCPRVPIKRSQECFINCIPGVPFGDVSSLSFPQIKSKKGKKKEKQPQLGDCSVENKLAGAETANIAKAPAGLTGGTLVPCSNGPKFPKCSRAKGGHKSRAGILDLPRKKDKASKKKGDKNHLVGNHQIDEKGDAHYVLSGMESHLSAGNQISSDLGEYGDLDKGSSGPINGLKFSSAELRDQCVPPRNAWVLCDECEKWRRIPATLADRIEETNCGWTCKDNTDKDFGDCSIPQEKSNSEINEELDISDASGEEDACDATLKSNKNRSKAAQKSSWSLIKSNLFLHRSRKTQTIDEVMVCHCKPPSDGRMGCGTKCLNRMLNIECVRGTCPCGEFCSNQQFQKRKYAKLKWLRCGKKGFGLQSLEDISEGKFLIEYVGEVLDIHAYEARQREYALQGHKHFYFMTLNGSEVIDACAKGNLGRYINHSCDPNCRTEKWMVNGEVCVGLFAVRDIKKGDEVTFDYNYVRVFGAAAKKCVCGSPNCRGYIGGDPTNSEAIVQGDSDDEHAEPVVICEDREMNDDWNDIMSNSFCERENGSANEPSKNRYRTKKMVNASGQFETIDSETSIQKMGVNSASTDGCIKISTATQVVNIIQDRTCVGNNFASTAVEPLDTGKDNGESLNTSDSAAFEVESVGLLSQIHSPVQLIDVSFQSEGIIMKKTMPSALHSAHESEITTTALPSKSQPDAVEPKRKLKHGSPGGKEELAKSDSFAKTRRSSSSIKKGKHKPNVGNEKGTFNVDRSNAATHKSKKLADLSVNSHAESVEEKLNELLDTEGGISKRKDASRGYLKLLFLTAASGTNGHGEAIQSNRDLSMILDALLKTKSRTVLVDIINKNGLQMLHNIMKRYRKEFIKTPILRKLLKVLEYLAMREILTLEHITGGPPCPGVESFKDSILTLTEHADKQVHQIARNFRDRWIPRSLRKTSFMEMDDGKLEFHQHGYGRLSVSSNDHSNDRSGKPAEAAECRDVEMVIASVTVETSTRDYSASGCSTGTNEKRTRKRKSRWDSPAEENPHFRIRTNMTGDGKPSIDEDIPPGFSSPCNGSVAAAPASSTAFNQGRETCIKLPSDVVLGDSHWRFIASIPVSYGVPSSVIQQHGVLKIETAEGWAVAPGLLYHPFPPLPPHACKKGDPPTSTAKCVSSSELAEKAEQGNATCVAHHSGQNRPMSCCMDSPEMNISVGNELPDFQREGGSHSLDRKFFRQQKWNQSKLLPPWVRIRNGWGHAGNTRNGMPGIGFGNGANQFRNSYIPPDNFNWRGEF